MKAQMIPSAVLSGLGYPSTTIRTLPPRLRILTSTNLVEADEKIRQHLSTMRNKSIAKKQNPSLTGISDSDLNTAISFLHDSFINLAARLLLDLAAQSPTVRIIFPKSGNSDMNTNRLPSALADLLMWRASSLSKNSFLMSRIFKDSSITIDDGPPRSMSSSDKGAAGLIMRKVLNQRQFVGLVETKVTYLIVDDGVTCQSLVANLASRLGRDAKVGAIIAPFPHMRGCENLYPNLELIAALKQVVIRRTGWRGWLQLRNVLLHLGIAIESPKSITRMEALALLSAYGGNSCCFDRKVFQREVKRATSYNLDDVDSPFLKSHFYRSWVDDDISCIHRSAFLNGYFTNESSPLHAVS